MQRRDLLAGGSSLMAVALAGCAFGDESEASGPADDTGDTDDENDTDDESEEPEGDAESDDETGSAGNESDDSAEDDGDDNETVGEDDETTDETDGNETTDETGGNETTDDGEDEASVGGDAEDSVLTISLEDGDGEPVSEGVVVTITGEQGGVSIAHNYQHDIEDGEIQQTVRAGAWTVAVEPAEDASFEPQEEEVEVEGDEEVTIELDGAPAGESEDEADAGEETADGEDGGDTDDEGGDEGDEGDEDGDTEEEDADDESDGDGDTEEGDTGEDGEETDESDEEGDGSDDEDTDTESETEEDEGATEDDATDDGDDATDDETGDGDDAAEEGDDETGTDATEPAPGEIPGLDRDALAAGGEVLAEIDAEREGTELVITAVPADESGGPRLQEVGAALDTMADAVSDPDALRSAIDRITVVVESAEGEELFSGSGGTGWLLAFA